MDIPLIYYAVTVIATGTVWLFTKKFSIGLLAGYTFFIIAETILIRTPKMTANYEFEFLWSWKAWQEEKKQILVNIAVFIPFGLLTGTAWKWRGMVVALGLSVMIEFLQLILHRGLCEFDDILHNTIGATIGILIALMYRDIYQIVSQNSK